MMDGGLKGPQSFLRRIEDNSWGPAGSYTGFVGCLVKVKVHVRTDRPTGGKDMMKCLFEQLGYGEAGWGRKTY